LTSGVQASRTLPAICVHNCSVSQVSFQALNGRSGQCEFQLIGIALQQMPKLLESDVAAAGAALGLWEVLRT
jgi:hypothetical protein